MATSFQHSGENFGSNQLKAVFNQGTAVKKCNERHRLGNPRFLFEAFPFTEGMAQRRLTAPKYKPSRLTKDWQTVKLSVGNRMSFYAHLITPSSRNIKALQSL